MSEKRFGWDCPYKDNRDFCTALLKPQICCPSICCFGLSDEIDEQQTSRIYAWVEDLLNENDEDFKIFKSCEIIEEDSILKVKAVFSDEFQEWLYYWLGEEIRETLTKCDNE